MTIVLRVDPAAPDPSAIARAAECLRDGGLVAFPTETVYGLGVHALDRDAVGRLYAAKGRPVSDPLIVHVSSRDDLRPLVSCEPDVVAELARRFWPGPLTLVLPRSAAVPDEITAGLDTVAIRVPAHPVAQALIRAAGVPVAAPSANLFSRPSPTLAAHVVEDLDGRIDMVIDGGPTTIGVESTVLDVTGATPVILRPGGVTLDALRAIIPDVRHATMTGDDAAMPSPGLLEKHYSPRTPLTLYAGNMSKAFQRARSDAERLIRKEGARVGLVVWAEERAALTGTGGLVVTDLGPRDRLDVAAARLYATLRDLDRASVDRILALDVSGDSGLAAAIRDRLTRAAAGRVVVVD